MFRLTRSTPIRESHLPTAPSIRKTRIRNQQPTTHLPPELKSPPTTIRPTNHTFTILHIKYKQRPRISTHQVTISSKRTNNTQTRNLQFHKTSQFNTHPYSRAHPRTIRRQLSKHAQRPFHPIPHFHHNRRSPIVNSRRQANKGLSPINPLFNNRQPHINQAINQPVSPRRMYKTTLIKFT